MAARASSTEAVARPRARLAAPAGWVPAALGIGWGHATLVGLDAVSPLFAVATRGGVSTPWPFAVLQWTLALPLTAAGAFVFGSADPLAELVAAGLPPLAMALPAVVGWSVVTLGTRAARIRTLRVPLLVALALITAAAGASLMAATTIVARERAAERLFLEMANTDEPPWSVAASRAAARVLVGDFAGTRWTSEGWRVIANDAEARGDPGAAARAWRAFGESFPDEAVPGRAVALLSLARAVDGRAPDDVAATHYLDARRTLARAGPHVQTWIAAEAAEALERLALRQGLHATANYWATRARAARTEGNGRTGG